MNEHDSIPLKPSGAPALDRAAGIGKDSPGVESTAGGVLRRARQAQGMDINAMAATLKVPVQKLQALEQDRFDLLLDPVFVRALASSVCRMLKLDPAPVLQRLPPIAAFKASSQNRGINTPFRPRESASGSTLGLRFSRRAVLLGLALLLATLVLIFLPFIQQEVAKYRAGAHAALAKDEVVELASRLEPATGNLSAVATSASSSTSFEAAPPPATPAFITGTATALVALPVEGATDSTVVFNAKMESWVRVTDAKGVVVLSRTLRPGESASVSGERPLAVAVGRADAVQVQVRGQVFDLVAVAKNNIARFEVK